MRLNPDQEKILNRGGIGIIPTDTIYGLVGSALRSETVERIYRARRRDPRKPFIVLIGSIADLDKFKVKIDSRQKRFLKTIWPGKVSVILPSPGRKFVYLHRGTGELAFRLPRSKALLSSLRKTGPLVAPSANPEGLPPAGTIKKAREYFKDKVDFYLGGGKKKGRPSTLIRLRGDNFEILRSGAVGAGFLSERFKTTKGKK